MVSLVALLERLVPRVAGEAEQWRAVVGADGRRWVVLGGDGRTATLPADEALTIEAIEAPALDGTDYLDDEDDTSDSSDDDEALVVDDGAGVAADVAAALAVGVS